MTEVWIFVFGMLVGIGLWNVAIITYRELYARREDQNLPRPLLRERGN